jgi:hypothetical protein
MVADLTAGLTSACSTILSRQKAAGTAEAIASHGRTARLPARYSLDPDPIRLNHSPAILISSINRQPGVR